jgi:hypothetical protein
MRTVVGGSVMTKEVFGPPSEAHGIEPDGLAGRGDSGRMVRSGSQASPSARQGFIMMSDDFS